MSHRRFLRLHFLTFLVSAMLMWASTAARAQLLTDLGTLGGASSQALAINDRLQVVGWSDKGSGRRAAFIANAEVANSMQELVDPFGQLGTATGINNFGEVCGWVQAADGKNHAWLWLSGLSDIQTVTGGLAGIGAVSSMAYGINDAGQVVGDLTLASGAVRAFVWDKTNGALLLPTLGGIEGHARGINQPGSVAGFSKNASGLDRAYSWSAQGGIHDLGVFAGGTESHAFAISDFGRIVGEAAVPNSQPTKWHAAQFGNPVVDLGTLGGPNSILASVNGAYDYYAGGSAQTASSKYHPVILVGGGLIDISSSFSGGPSPVDILGMQPRVTDEDFYQDPQDGLTYHHRRVWVAGTGTAGNKQRAVSFSAVDGLICDSCTPTSGGRGIGSIACNRAQAVAGETLMGTAAGYISLPGDPAAGPDYMTFRLSSSSPSVRVPSAITIPPNIASVDFPIEVLDPTSHEVVTITYEVTYPYASGQPITIDIYPSTATHFQVSDAAGKIGDTISLQASLIRDIDGLPAESLPVTFNVGGAVLGPVTTDAGGTATVSYTIPESLGTGAKSVMASFAGTSTYLASSSTATLTVSKATTITKAATASGYRGDTVTLAATLTRTFDLAPLAGRTLAFYIGSTKLATAVTDANGVAQTSYVISSGAAIGSIGYSAKFAGDAKYGASSGSGKIYVKDTTTVAVSPASGMIGQTVTLTASLKRNTDGLALSGKTLTFVVDGMTAGTATTSTSGVASRSYKIPFSAGVGIRTVTVTFAGDPGYGASSATSTLTVVKTNTSMTVTNLSGSPGAKVTLKAALKRTTDGGGVAAATVSFKVDGVLVGTAVTSSSGSAAKAYTIPASFLSGSAHTVTVEFTGNANYNPSSGAGTLTVL